MFGRIVSVELLQPLMVDIVLEHPSLSDNNSNHDVFFFVMYV